MEEGGDFGYDDPDLDYDIDHDDNDQEVNRTQPFQVGAASTPYHGGEQHEMQTMGHEQEGLPSYDEKTPLIDPDEDLERRLRNLRKNELTGILDISKIKGRIENPLSYEGQKEQIMTAEKFIIKKFPHTNVDGLVISYSKKNPMELVVVGPRGGETKIFLDNGGDFQKSFLKSEFIKKQLGPPAGDKIQKRSANIEKEKKELKKLRNYEQLKRSKDEKMQDIIQKLNREEAGIEQLKDDQETDNKAEIKRKEQLVINLKKERETLQKDRRDLQKKLENKNIDQLESSISEEERKRNAMEESHLLRLNEEDQAIIQDEMAPSLDKEATEERVAARNEEIARLQTRISEREANKKYGVTAGITVGAVAGSITKALKATGKAIGKGLKDIGAKIASLLAGLIGSIVSFLFKTAGQAVGFLAEHTWLLILAAVVFIFEKYIKKRR